MLEGKCPECGFHRIGWALRIPLYQICPKCGTSLEITEPDYISRPAKEPPHDNIGEDGRVDLPPKNRAG